MYTLGGGGYLGRRTGCFFIYIVYYSLPGPIVTPYACFLLAFLSAVASCVAIPERLSHFKGTVSPDTGVYLKLYKIKLVPSLGLLMVF
jgi:hypothetical protein